jgi:hypothetical protein
LISTGAPAEVKSSPVPQIASRFRTRA